MKKQTPPVHFTTPGTFAVGCNYWASHAGTAMWRDWQAGVVANDLCRLAAEGVQVMRVFPLWSDFQPIQQLRGGAGNPVEIRHDEEPLPMDALGRAGLSAVAMAHFAEFADLAAKHKITLVVGLVTGWMSGRLFVPPALEGLNVITDPRAIQWQVRFVREFVGAFRGHPAIVAWDLGNECNCMGKADRAAAWSWTATIANTIRAADPSRPIISGMHGLGIQADAVWNIHDQAELTDILTTHPYPCFTPYCDQDPLDTMRPTLHATAESCLYADLGGKPCLVEEIGNLGSMFASDELAARYIETVLFSSWAHDLRGLLWWCGFDQLHLEHAPYDWNTVERELGLLRRDGSAKPAMKALGRFREVIANLPIPALPPRVTDAVCILSAGQDTWQVGYSAFILAKQAGFDLRFTDQEQELPEAPLYLVPALKGHSFLSRRYWLKLLDRVRAGATLYVSHDDAIIPELAALAGLRVVSRSRRSGPANIAFASRVSPDLALQATSAYRLELEVTRAEVLAKEADGNPAFSVAALGKGKVFFLSVPVEADLMSHPGTFHGPTASPFWRVYRFLRQQVRCDRVLEKESPLLAVTEHILAADRRVAVCINHGVDAQRFDLALAKGWRVAATWHGPAAKATRAGRYGLRIPGNTGVVLELRLGPES